MRWLTPQLRFTDDGVTLPEGNVTLLAGLAAKRLRGAPVLLRAYAEALTRTAVRAVANAAIFVPRLHVQNSSLSRHDANKFLPETRRAVCSL